MKGNIRQILSVILGVFTCVIMIAGTVFVLLLPKEEKKEVFVDKHLVSTVLLKGAENIHEIWKNGVLALNKKSFESSCPKELGDLSNTDLSYLKCNPNFLTCFFKHNTAKNFKGMRVKYQGHEFHIKVNQKYSAIKRYGQDRRFYRIITRSNTDGPVVPSYAAVISLSLAEFPDYEMEFMLFDSCSDSYLPQRIYAYGAMFSKLQNLKKGHSFFQNWQWDNFGRHLYVDKFLVSFRDIAEWLDYDKNIGDLEKGIKIPQDRAMWPSPATGLNLLQMKRYCAFRSKSLLEAHLFDAATFYPGDIKNPKPVRVSRGPYPWTRKHNTFVQRYLKKPSEKNLNCDLIYSKECQVVEPLRTFNSRNTSWMEINQILGGYLEAFRNGIEPDRNLKVSSYYFSLKSPWHQLGVRGSWNGLAGEKQEVVLDLWEDEKEELGNGPLNIGFRCYRQMRGEK